MIVVWAFETDVPRWQRKPTTTLENWWQPPFSVSNLSTTLCRRSGLRQSLSIIVAQVKPCNRVVGFSSGLKMLFGIGDNDNDDTPSRGGKNNNYVNINNDPDILLKMVEDLTIVVDDVTPELMDKMEKVEIALAKFLDEKSSAMLQQQGQIDKQLPPPPPPSIPPPMGALYQSQDMLSNDLIRAEQALEKLRQRLRREEAALFQAEKALQRSMEEQDILRKAEEALQKSREAAARREVDTARRNEITVADLGRSQEQSQTVTPERRPQPLKAIMSDLSTKNLPRPTLELGNLFGRNGSNKRPTSAPLGMPILYNWIQEADGSIRGNVKLSPNFADGATISTSALKGDAQSGTVVTTASGSQ
jgi:hypothetical protein